MKSLNKFGLFICTFVIISLCVIPPASHVKELLGGIVGSLGEYLTSKV
jgi:hypothetical protein